MMHHQSKHPKPQKNTPEKEISEIDTEENSPRPEEPQAKTNTMEKKNSMKRRNSKKKKDSEPEKKFKDDIDQALHEIQLMEKETQSRSNTNSLKSKRPSKKYKKAPASEEVASDPLLQGEEKKVAVQLRVRVADMKEPSDDEDDDEEIQCLVEEPVKSTTSQEMKISMTSSKTQAITQKSESEAKPAGIALPITEMTDDWMDDDMAPGGMDSDTESENLKEEVATKSPQTQDVTGERKPAVAGIALPITEMTDDWMDDGEAIGSMQSEEEEGPAKPEENPVEE